MGTRGGIIRRGRRQELNGGAAGHWVENTVRVVLAGASGSRSTGTIGGSWGYGQCFGARFLMATEGTGLPWVSQVLKVLRGADAAWGTGCTRVHSGLGGGGTGGVAGGARGGGGGGTCCGSVKQNWVGST